MRTMCSCSGSGTGNERHTSALATENIALLAPMPAASDNTTTIVKPGLVRNFRNA